MDRRSTRSDNEQSLVSAVPRQLTSNLVPKARRSDRLNLDQIVEGGPIDTILSEAEMVSSDNTLDH